MACAATYVTMKYFKLDNYQICYDRRLFNLKKQKKGIDKKQII